MLQSRNEDLHPTIKLCLFGCYENMITFVYCCICLLVVCCQSTYINTEEYNNDSPDTLPRVQNVRHKVGSEIRLKCTDHHHYKNEITWEFKHCETNFKGIQCPKDLYNETGNWKTLDFGKGKRRLDIFNSSEDNSGYYRCIHDNTVAKIFIVEVVSPAKYKGPPPKVISVLATNSSVMPNSHFAIMCNATSISPPVIRWFKECSGKKCDVRENDRCYCTIPTSNSFYASGDNIYLSKLNVYNARNVDSGIYACLVVSLYGKDYKNISIRVKTLGGDEVTHKSLSLLFLIPLAFLLVPITVWLCYYRRKTKQVKASFGIGGDQQARQLIKPVVHVDIVLERSEIV